MLCYFGFIIDINYGSLFYFFIQKCSEDIKKRRWNGLYLHGGKGTACLNIKYNRNIRRIKRTVVFNSFEILRQVFKYTFLNIIYRKKNLNVDASLRKLSSSFSKNWKATKFYKVFGKKKYKGPKDDSQNRPRLHTSVRVVIYKWSRSLVLCLGKPE